MKDWTVNVYTGENGEVLLETATVQADSALGASVIAAREVAEKYGLNYLDVWCEIVA